MITSAKLISLSFLSIGIILLSQIMLPLVSFKLFEISKRYEGSNLISPQSNKSGHVLGVSIKQEQTFSYFVSNSRRENKPAYDEFTISIPSIKIDHAKVFVDSNNFSKALAQLPGSALPGEKGNLFISGHSSLSEALSIQNSVFAKLPDVKKGDIIEVFAQKTKFKYRVISIKIVDPKDVSVIAPINEMGRFISLMTCVPPGLNFKRLIVMGEII